MPANLMVDSAPPQVSRCAFCFQPKGKKNLINKKIIINDINYQAPVCDERCGKLWHEKMRQDFDRMLAFSMKN